MDQFLMTGAEWLSQPWAVAVLAVLTVATVVGAVVAPREELAKTSASMVNTAMLTIAAWMGADELHLYLRIYLPTFALIVIVIAARVVIVAVRGQRVDTLSLSYPTGMRRPQHPAHGARRGIQPQSMRTRN